MNRSATDSWRVNPHLGFKWGQFNLIKKDYFTGDAEMGWDFVPRHNETTNSSCSTTTFIYFCQRQENTPKITKQSIFVYFFWISSDFINCFQC